MVLLRRVLDRRAEAVHHVDPVFTQGLYIQIRQREIIRRRVVRIGGEVGKYVVHVDVMPRAVGVRRVVQTHNGRTQTQEIRQDLAVIDLPGAVVEAVQGLHCFDLLPKIDTYFSQGAPPFQTV